jgi:hypothetical protein
MEPKNRHNLHIYLGIDGCIKDTTDYISIRHHLDNVSYYRELETIFSPNDRLWDDYENNNIDIKSYYRDIVDGKIII